MVIGLIDSYGYGALIEGVAGYHLFPDFVGGQDEKKRLAGIETGKTLIDFIMKTKGASSFIAGELSLADLYLAPIVAYVAMTPDKDAVLSADGFPDWWKRVQTVPSFES